MITHLMVSEDVGSVHELAIKSKRLITIKKTWNLLGKDVQDIKLGPLYKQSDNFKKQNEQYIRFFATP